MGPKWGLFWALFWALNWVIFGDPLETHEITQQDISVVKTPHFRGIESEFGVFGGFGPLWHPCPKRSRIGVRSTIVESGSRPQTLDLFQSSIKWVSETRVPNLHVSFRDPILDPFWNTSGQDLLHSEIPLKSHDPRYPFYAPTEHSTFCTSCVWARLVSGASKYLGSGPLFPPDTDLVLEGIIT